MVTCCHSASVSHVPTPGLLLVPPFHVQEVVPPPPDVAVGVDVVPSTPHPSPLGSALQLAVGVGCAYAYAVDGETGETGEPGLAKARLPATTRRTAAAKDFSTRCNCRTPS
jgi:hypothetical protein